jgi:hypothetical protein
LLNRFAELWLRFNPVPHAPAVVLRRSGIYIPPVRHLLKLRIQNHSLQKYCHHSRPDYAIRATSFAERQQFQSEMRCHNLGDCCKLAIVYARRKAAFRNVPRGQFQGQKPLDPRHAGLDIIPIESDRDDETIAPAGSADRAITWPNTTGELLNTPQW